MQNIQPFNNVYIILDNYTDNDYHYQYNCFIFDVKTLSPPFERVLIYRVDCMIVAPTILTIAIIVLIITVLSVINRK